MYKIKEELKMKNRKTRTKRKVDLILLICQIILMTIGLILVLSPKYGNVIAVSGNNPQDTDVVEMTEIIDPITETESPQTEVETETQYVESEITEITEITEADISEIDISDDTINEAEIMPRIVESNDEDDSDNTYELKRRSVTLEDCLGNDIIKINGVKLKRYNLPDAYYTGIDFSTFQPYMDYRYVSNPDSASYSVVYSSKAYIDEYGLRRLTTSDSQFTINGQDDYMVGLGTYYKPKGVAGLRYLIVTSTGMYTCVTGDEKDDRDTDSHNMFSTHGNNNEYAGIIEWIVDTKSLNRSIKRAGTVTAGPITELQGEIKYIYMIEE
jgi:hypothetical protein